MGSGGIAAIACALTLLCPAVVQAGAASGDVTVQYRITPSVRFTLTPNYNTGYGPIPATFGAPPAPSPGAGACLQGCAVDFGTAEAGFTYLYKYAAHISVNTNDTSGFNLYGEGAADMTDGSGNSIALGQSLFYLPSGATSDTNTGFSAGLPFAVTSGTVTPGVPDPNTPASIAYVAYPAPMYSAAGAGTTDYYQDYQLKVPYTATSSSYFVWIVYTVVAK